MFLPTLQRLFNNRLSFALILFLLRFVLQAGIADDMHHSNKCMEVNMEIELTKANFDEEISKDTPILVDFWASWCGPCRMLSGTIEQLANESDGSYRVGKVNVDEQPELSERYHIMSIPTLIVFKNGAIVNQDVGVLPKGKILQMLK